MKLCVTVDQRMPAHTQGEAPHSTVEIHLPNSEAHMHEVYFKFHTSPDLISCYFSQLDVRIVSNTV